MTCGSDFSGIPRFDMTEALRRCMGKEDFVEELSGIFVKESLPMYLPKLKQGILENDYSLITKNSHGIKGGCGAIGLVRAREMAYAMEMASKEQDMKKVQEIMPCLVAELDEIVEGITKGKITDL